MQKIQSDIESDIPLFINNTKCRSSKPLTTIIKSKSKKSLNEKFCKDPSIKWEPFLELGAVNRLITILKSDCLKITESTESCLREIIFRLENLLKDWTKDDEKIKNLLANDNCLIKCEQCGVISLRKRKYRGICKPLEKNTKSLKTNSCLPTLPKGRFENPGYSRVYEERRKLVQKDEKKSNFCRNFTIRDVERCKRFKSDDSSRKQFSHLCGSMTAEKEIDSILDNEKKFDDQKFDQNHNKKCGIRKFDKYSNRPLIEVSAPARKASNIPRSNARLAQVALNRKINRRNIKIIPKKVKINGSESNSTIIKITNEKDFQESKNDEPEILNESRQNLVSQELLSKAEDLENSLNLKFPEKFNDFHEANKSSKEQPQNNQDQFNHLEKGDCSSFHEKKDSSFISKMTGFPHQICDPNDNPNLGSAHWTLNDENQLEKSKLETVKQELSCKNVSQSQVEKSETTGFSSSSAENLINEWLTASLKQSRILKINKSLEKTLQSTGMQTVSCSSLDIIRRMRAQITEVIDKFTDCKLIEDKSNRIDEHENKTQNRKTNQQEELQMSYKNSSTMTSSIWEIYDLGPDHSENSKQQIASEKFLSPEIVSTISLHEATSKLFSMYSNLLEGNEEMDWETFEELVETLNPTQRQLWKDICTAVKNEAKRVAGKCGASTEVCIEIKSVSKKKKRKEKKGLESGEEIAFEMDMTLKDMENFLEKHLRSCLLGTKMKKMDKVEESFKKKGK